MRRIDRDNEVLAFIKEFVKEKSISPTYRDIQRGCNIPSSSTVGATLHRLEAEHRIQIYRGKTRAIKVLDDYDDCFCVVRISIIKGSCYIVECKNYQRDAIVAALNGVNSGGNVLLCAPTIQECIKQIKAEQSLRYEDYMFVDFAELMYLIRDITPQSKLN